MLEACFCIYTASVHFSLVVVISQDQEYIAGPANGMQGPLRPSNQ